MEKVCRDWAKQAFGEGLVKAEYWNDFETNAKTAAAEVFRVKNFAEGEAKLQELLKEYADMEVYIENMFDLDSSLIVQLAKRMKDEPRFGICLDIAHAFISDESIESWCNSVLPYVRHVHINDNNGIEDSHTPVGSASIPWSVYNNFMDSFASDAKPSVLIEVRGYEALEKSVEYMMQNHMYPFP